MKKAYKFGLEIECIVPFEHSNKFLREVNKLGCKVAYDESIHSEEGEGKEVVTPPLGYNNTHRLLGKLGRMFDKLDIQVNQTCGLHIHASNKRFFSQRNLKKIIKAWIAIEDVMFATQPPSRLKNSYCRRMLGKFVNNAMPNLPVKKQDLIDEAHNVDRYGALNLNALAKHGTLEIRLHSGTTNAEKMRSWLELTRGFFTYCLVSYNSDEVEKLMGQSISQAKVDKVFKLFGLSDKTKKFYKSRIRTNLFSTLTQQQQGANKYLKLKPEIDKRRKTLDRAQERFRESDREASEIRQIFGHRY